MAASGSRNSTGKRSEAGAGGDDETRYVALAEELRRQIRSGALGPGDRLPSFSSVRASHGVAQGTIEKAHGLLEREGLVERRRRQGVFVVRRPEVQEPSSASKPSARSGPDHLLEHAVAILTLVETPTPKHLSDGWSEHITLGAMSAANAAQFHVLTLHPGRSLVQGADRLIAAAPMGVIASEITSGNAPDREAWATAKEFLTRVREAGIPVVVYGDHPELAEFDRVTPDHEEGGYQVTCRLIGQGKRRIANVWNAPAGSYWLAERQRGYERAMREADLEPRDAVVIPPLTYTAPASTRERFDQSLWYFAGSLASHLLGTKGLDAVAASTDGEVFALMGAARLLGRIPGEDIVFAGYDDYWRDLPEQDWEPSVPAVTVNKCNRAAGVEMVRLLGDRIAGRLPAEPQRRTVRPEIVSTADTE